VIVVREVDPEMITKEILVVARVEARAETLRTNTSCTDEKRWVGINAVEVVHEFDPIAGQDFVGVTARGHREWWKARVVKSMIVERWIMRRIRECALRSVEWGPHVSGERIGRTMRRGHNLERRARSLCVLVDGNDEGAAARDRITKVRVCDGSICNHPTILPEPVNKV